MALKKLDVRGAKCPIPIARASAKHALLKEQRSEKDEAGKDLCIHLLERT